MEITEVVTIEYLPGLDCDLESPDRVSVRFEFEPRGGTLNFKMIDTTPWPPGSNGRAVMKDTDGNTYLVVERGQDRIFDFELSPNWRWQFDRNANTVGEPITFKRGDAPLYRVVWVSPTRLEIYAKARPHMPTGMARDFFNIYVLFDQDSGTPIALRIDPGTNNPPRDP